jgi:filamentous hemagglutinin family protein
MARRPHLATWFVAASLLAVSSAISLRANPTGESVVAGNANFQRNGNTLQITTGVRSIINWQDFSIASGETTKFLQPSSSAVSLNRVVSGNPSSIYGSLQANGHVWLINPNGILVSSGAKIDTAGFLASTLDASNAEFLKGGDVNFVGSSAAKVVNRGAINAIGGDVFLFARQVENSGAISAAKGTAGLAAGQEILLKQAGPERVFVKPAGASAGGTGVDNSGSIAAVQAELKAHGNMYALAINNSGVVRANTAVTQNGRVLLKSASANASARKTRSNTASAARGTGGQILVDGGAGGVVTNSGTLDASGSVGGTIHVLGDQINIPSGRIDASGTNGGGTVLIGGDAHGAGTVQNASSTTVGSAAQISADALASGNGGKVVVWADDATRFSGSISARGGAGGGNGGFVEVSGKNNLAFNGHVDTGAARGLAGTLLLDPRDAFVQAGAGPDDLQVSDGKVLFADGGAATDFTISNTALMAQTGNIVLQAQRDIAVQSGATLNLINQTAGERFVMQAGRNISINAPITTAGADIFLEAGSTFSPTPDSGGTLMIASPISTSNGGFINLLAPKFSITSIVNSGNRRSTRIATPDGSAFGIGAGGAITGASLDNLVSTYQVWIGDALSAGSAGTGSVDRTVANLTVDQATILHNHAALLFSSQGDVTLNQSLTTSTRTLFQTAPTGGTLPAFNVADGATLSNVSGGVQIDTFSINLNTTGAISVPGQLSIGRSDSDLLGVGISVGTPAVPPGAQARPPIFISNDALSRISAGQLLLYTSDASDIIVDGVSTNIAQVTLAAGARGAPGAVFIQGNPSTFNGLTVAANGGVTVSADVTANSGPVSINADRFGENSGVFRSVAKVIAAANQPITIEASDVDIGDALIANGGAITLRPSAVAATVGVGTGAGAFSVGQTDLDNLGSGHASLTIGRADGKNAITVGAATFADPVLIESPAATGSIGVSGAVSAPGGITLLAPTNTLGTSSTPANITTTAQPIAIKGAATLGGDATLTTNGAAITFTGTINGAHNLTFAAGAGAISLGGPGFAATGTISPLTSVAANGATIRLPSIKTTGAQNYTGDVSLNGRLWSTTSGAITLGGNLTLLGNDTITSSGANAGADVEFDGTINGARALTVSSGTAAGVVVTHAVGDVTPLLALTITAAQLSGAVDGSMTVNGALSIKTTQADIGNSSFPWHIAGRTTLNAGTHNILLATPSSGTNTFGSLALTGANVTVNENADTDLGALVISGSLTVTSTGGISDSGNVSVGGAASFTGTGIALNSAGNRYAGGISFSAPGSVILANAGTTTQLDNANIGGNLTVIASGSLAQTATGALSATGAVTLQAATDINLPQAANSFGSLIFHAGRNVTIRQSSAMSLGPSVARGSLALTAGGAITQNGEIDAATANFTSASDITLDNATNNIGGAAGFTTTGGGNVVYKDAHSISLGASVVSGGFSVTGPGIVSTSNISVAGAASFTSTASGVPITLSGAGNAFTGSLALNTTAAAATVINGTATNLGASAVAGAFSLRSGGDVTQSGALNVSGALSLNVTGAITLDFPSNTTFGSNALSTLGTISSTRAVKITDSSGGLIVAGSVNKGASGANPVTIATAGGNLTLNGGVNINGSQVVLATDGVNGNFINNAGESAVTTPAGRFLIYSTDPNNTVLGGLPFLFIDYHETYPSPPNNDPGPTASGVIFSASGP